MKKQPDEIVALVQRRVNERKQNCKQNRWFVPFIGGGVVLGCCYLLKIVFARQEAIGGGLLMDVNFWFGVVFTMLFLFMVVLGLLMLLTLMRLQGGIETHIDNLLLELWEEQRRQKQTGEQGNASH